MAEQNSASRSVSRRSFLRSAGALAGAAGVLSISRQAMAYGPSSSYLPGSLVKATLKRVDEFPYELGDVQRFPEYLNAFGSPPGYKEFRANIKNGLPEKLNKVPGFSTLDYALQSAAWTSQRGVKLYSWAGLGVSKLLPGTSPWQGTPEEANIIVKKAARVFGAADCGITATNPLWFFSTAGKSEDAQTPIVFADVPAPTQTPEASTIPNSMKSVIVLIVPMDLQIMQFTPSPLGEAAVGIGYSRMAEVASKMSEFIRGLGYQAIPMGNDTGLSVPLAIEAGLGEQGRAGILVHPVLGTCLRICKVLTDLPIAADKPITFGVHEFCKTCKKCARECPSGAISMDDDYNQPIRPSNNPGPKKWYADTWKCHAFWTENGTDCGACQRTCPYNKPQTWLHDTVKGMTATVTILDPVFIKLDNPDDAARFWQEVEWPKKG